MSRMKNLSRLLQADVLVDEPSVNLADGALLVSYSTTDTVIFDAIAVDWLPNSVLNDIEAVDRNSVIEIVNSPRVASTLTCAELFGYTLSSDIRHFAIHFNPAGFLDVLATQFQIHTNPVTP